ncbi:hypothetical protein RHMOL_Rhmol12G0007100 [Rhododendron molle]|nr:hypothetical protein RHMOL_Rhmol12G0007100 [Rhododendron molle]
MNGSRSLVFEMRSKPSDARSNGVHNMVLCTSLRSTNPKSLKKVGCLASIRQTSIVLEQLQLFWPFFLSQSYFYKVVFHFF